MCVLMPSENAYVHPDAGKEAPMCVSMCVLAQTENAYVHRYVRLGAD